MKNYCATCHIKNCELRDQINFCEDCADYANCTICYEYCDNGHAVECNNGFEIDENSYPYDEIDEFELFFGGLYENDEENDDESV